MGRSSYRVLGSRRVLSHSFWTASANRLLAGKLDEAGRLGVQQAAEGTGQQIESASQRSGLSVSEAIEPLGRQMRFEFDDDPAATQPRWAEVNTAGVLVENLRQFGGPWLALHLIRTLHLDSFLERTIPEGQVRVAWDLSSLILMTARLLEPSSELHTAEHWYPKTALPDLFGCPREVRQRQPIVSNHGWASRGWPRCGGTPIRSVRTSIR